MARSRREDPVKQALQLGAHRSLRACSLPANDHPVVAIWRAHRWTISAAALFLFVELLGLGALAGNMNHF